MTHLCFLSREVKWLKIRGWNAKETRKANQMPWPLREHTAIQLLSSSLAGSAGDYCRLRFTLHIVSVSSLLSLLHSGTCTKGQAALGHGFFTVIPWRERSEIHTASKILSQNFVYCHFPCVLASHLVRPRFNSVGKYLDI